MTNSKKKLVILQIDGTDIELQEMMTGLSNLGNHMGYEFIISNREIKFIPEEELFRVLLRSVDTRLG